MKEHLKREMTNIAHMLFARAGMAQTTEATRANVLAAFERLSANEATRGEAEHFLHVYDMLASDLARIGG